MDTFFIITEFILLVLWPIILIAIIAILITKLFKKKNVNNDANINVSFNKESVKESLFYYIVRTNKKIFVPASIFLILVGFALFLIDNLPLIIGETDPLVLWVLMMPLVFFGSCVLIFLFIKLIITIIHFYILKNKNKITSF